MKGLSLFLLLAFILPAGLVYGKDTECGPALVDLKLRTHEFSWKHWSPYKDVPENATFVDQVENEVHRMFPSGNIGTPLHRLAVFFAEEDAHPLTMVQVMTLIQNIRARGYPVKETFELLGIYQDLVRIGKNPYTTLPLAQAREKFLMMSSNFNMINVHGFYPKPLFSLSRVEPSSIPSAVDAGVIYISDLNDMAIAIREAKRLNSILNAEGIGKNLEAANYLRARLGR